MNKTSKSTREYLKELQHKRGVQEHSQALESGFSPWHQAAAVLVQFDPHTLRPFGADPDGREEGLRRLLKDCNPVSAGSDERWTLTDGVRRKVLRSLKEQVALLAALEANPQHHDAAGQKLMSGLIRGEPLSLTGLSRDELASVMRIVSWLRGIIDGLPTRQEIQHAFEQLTLLDPFHHLANDHFLGRGDELKEMADFIKYDQKAEAAEHRSGSEESAKKPPLVIHGPGGMGKSTLISAFILEHMGKNDKEPFPWIYIDFDRPVVLPRVPFTILIEGIKQIGIQYPKARQSATLLAKRWQKEILDKRPTDKVTSYEIDSWERACHALSSLLDTLSLSSRPLVIVLDTFEEVQSRGRRTVEKFLQFVRTLQNHIPQVRLIFSGRAPLDRYGHILQTRSLPLKAFDQKTARKYLRERKVKKESLIKRLAEISQGSPLALWLIARLCDEHEDIAELDLRRITIEQIQVILFDRILGHIHSADERVRALAHPGLILRRITAEIIMKVLAGHCGITLQGENEAEKLKDANRLYEDLKVEVALVKEIVDEKGEPALYHRADLRRLMLGMLRQSTDKEKIKEIEKEIVAYYEARPSATHLAEEIYHRLRLGQGEEILNQRWQSGPIKTGSLPSAKEEISPGMWQWLASKLDMELTEEENELASHWIWEKQAALKATYKMEKGRLAEALAELDQRSDRLPGSGLFALEAEIRQRLGQTETALEIIQNGLASAEEEANVLLTVKLLLQQARIERNKEDFQAAQASLAEVENHLKALARPPALANLRLQQEQLILARLIGRDDEDHLDQLDEAFAQLDDHTIRDHIDLMGEIVSLVDIKKPKILWRIIEATGIEREPQTLVRQLAAEIAHWDKAVSMSRKRSAGVIAGHYELSREGSLSQAWARYLLSSPKLNTTLLDMVDRFPPAPVGFLRAVANLLANRYRDSQGQSEITTDRAGGQDQESVEATLTDRQFEELEAEIKRLFTRQELSDIIYYRVGQSLEAISVDQKSQSFVTSMLHYLSQQNLIRNLLIALKNARPQNPVFPKLLATYYPRRHQEMPLSTMGEEEDLVEAFAQLAVAEEGGVATSESDTATWRVIHDWVAGSDIADLTSILERLFEVGFLELDVDEWMNIYLELTHQVALVKFEESRHAGILVGPDLLLTVPPTDSGRLAGDQIAINFSDSARFYRLNHSDWRLTRSKTDYALLRLAEKVGTLPIGQSYEFEVEASHRGWVELPYVPENIAKKDRGIVVILHDIGRTSRRIRGQTGRIIRVEEDGTFTIETSLKEGYIGSPVFDKNLELLGLLIAPAAENESHFVGLSLRAIVAQMRKANEFFHLVEGQSGDNAIGGTLGSTQQITVHVGGDVVGTVHFGNVRNQELEEEAGRSKETKKGDVTTERQLEALALLNKSAESHLKKGLTDRAINFYKKGLELAREINSPDTQVDQLVRLAGAQLTAGQVNVAQELFELCNGLVDPNSSQKAVIYDNLGVIQRLNGDLDGSISYFRRSLAITNRIGDHKNQAVTAANLGLAYQFDGKEDEAIKVYDHALELFNKNHDHGGFANTALNLGEIFINQKNFDDANKLLTAGLDASKEVKDSHLEGKYYHSIALVHAGQNRAQQAVELINRSLDVMREVGDRHSEVHILHDLGVMLTEQSLYEQATETLKMAYHLARDLNDLPAIGSVAAALGNVFGQLRENSQARQYFKIALSAYRRLKVPEAEQVQQALAQMDEENSSPPPQMKSAA